MGLYVMAEINVEEVQSEVIEEMGKEDGGVTLWSSLYGTGQTTVGQRVV